MKKKDLEINDSVKVKNGILCPDQKDLSISGWQGRISEIIEDDDGNMIIRIEWDAITLKNMPYYYIDQCDEEDLDYSAMYLGTEEVELTIPRDKKEDVAEMIDKIFKTRAWGWLGEEGKRIQKVLAYVDEDDEMEALEAWENYLEKTLSFPFDAIITGGPDKGPLKTGDKVSVKKISLVEEFHGIIVELNRGHHKYDHPLCDMEVINHGSSNYQPVYDYCIWSGNH